jgi:endonuclease/exonuclease/phosphatase family metal-dependent hydrolase
MVDLVTGGAPLRLRVMTLNVQNTTAGDPRRLQLLNDAIRQLKADVVSLQEVMSTKHLDALLDNTGLHGTHQSQVLDHEPPFVDQYGGTAVASRWPHRVVEVLDQRLTDAPDVPWCTLAAVIPVPDLGELLAIATTSSWRLDAEAARERQALALADLDARHRRALPTVIAGDLNADPDSASIRFLTGRQSLAGRSVHYHDSWAIAGDGPGYTWTDANANAAEEIGAVVRQPRHRRRLDYVLLGSWHAHPTARAEVRFATLVGPQTDGAWASDHFGVIADVDFSCDH